MGMQMKIVSLLIFGFALIGTWRMAHSRGPMSQSVHVGIQTDLKKIITEYVQKNRPESRNMRFHRFWTESVKKDKIKATFTYSFEDSTEEAGPTSLEISGYALLNKVNEDAAGVTYSLDELHILDNAIRFEEPIQITTGATDSDGSAGAAPIEPQPETSTPATTEETK